MADTKAKYETLPCPECKQRSTVEMTYKQYIELVGPNRRHIQDIFPEWPADQRELIMTGMHPACWDKVMGEEY
jgi:hypothetical protein